MDDLRITESLTIPADQLQWSYARASGPGGQNVNKVNSKATLRWSPAPGTLPPAMWNRFRRQAKRYLTTEGDVVIQSQDHRERARNVAACRDKLVALLVAASRAPKRRVATRPTRASRLRRLDEKRQQADKKRSRRGTDLT